MARTAISFARHRQFRASGVEAEAPPGRRSRARGGQFFFLTHRGGQLAGAIFIFFIFIFYKNIFSFPKFTEIYPGRPAAGRPGPGRPAAGRQRLFRKNFRGEFALRPLEDRSPGSGAAGCPSTI